jgi:hypothetical protein
MRLESMFILEQATCTSIIRQEGLLSLEPPGVFVWGVLTNVIEKPRKENAYESKKAHQKFALRLEMETKSTFVLEEAVPRSFSGRGCLE